MASAITDKIRERRSRVFLEPLPHDFLRITASVQQQQEAADRQAALALHQQYLSTQPCVTNILGRLSVCVAQAKLAKNYGMVRMDPYARIRVGHCVYETHSDTSGGKNPRWNKVVQCLLPQGVNTMSIEIYDERSFTMDELVAWTQINIPQQVLTGETHEDWYPLSGKQGEGVEGMINLVLSYTPQAPLAPLIYPATNITTRQIQPLAIYPVPPAQVNVPILSESDLKQIEEMFPNIDKEVIKTVFEANRGNKDGTINSLLQMGE